jgi:hypothetical protein
MLFLNGITDRPTAIKNPQANAICERLHQTVGNILRTLLHSPVPLNMIQARKIIDSALPTASYSCRVAIYRTLRISPGALVFHRDMVLNIPIIADLQVIKDRRQNLIDESLRRSNLKRYDHDYHPGQEILLLIPDPGKLNSRTSGPFTISQVHVNGTVTFQRTPHVYERINIRRIRPWRQV